MKPTGSKLNSVLAGTDINKLDGFGNNKTPALGKARNCHKKENDMKYSNCTPHAITADGVTYPPSGDVARVAATFSEFVDGVCRQQFGAVTGIPAPVDGVRIIVSAMVLGASDRADLVAPATGHPETVRNDRGHILSVPGFVVAS